YDEIIDFSGEKLNKVSIPCSVGFITIFIVAFINIIMMILFPESYISMYISLIIIGVFLLYYYYLATKNPGKIRKFSISTEYIQFLLPNIPLFTITWFELDRIEIRMRKLDFKPFIRYDIHFVTKESEKVYNISMLDFHKEKIDQILLLLKRYAIRMKKNFTAVKETKISGVILVENLKI
ncbi:MAG: hypothetical protein ACFFDY_12180, partial [Candidatus Thorarchaeota archaeon]